MSDRETERRMLDTALALVHDRGLSTGLESIAFDEVIRDAGVSRTSAYRRWPQRDRFYNEVLLELAARTKLPAPEATMAGPVAQVVFERYDKLGSPQGHRDLVVELLRVSIGIDFEIMNTSSQARTYRLLLACHEGIADQEVRDGVTAALITAEQGLLEARARVYAEFSAVLGYRLAAPLMGPSGFEFMSRAAGAAMTGVLARVALGDPFMQNPHPMRAFGSTEVSEWSPAVYMVTATVLSYIEPDPGVDWTQERIEDLVTAIKQISPTAL